jgi:hypothetical protein
LSGKLAVEYIEFRNACLHFHAPFNGEAVVAVANAGCALRSALLPITERSRECLFQSDIWYRWLFLNSRYICVERLTGCP